MSFMCLEMVLRQRRLYDLVIDPAAHVDATKESSRISGIEDNRSWWQLVTAQVRAIRWRRKEHPPPGPTKQK